MLDDAATLRYARQVVVPGIGGAGQEKLLACTVLVVGAARGVAQAALYLAAAGARVVRSIDEPFDVAVAADAGGLDAATREALVSRGRPACWYVLDDDGFTAGVHPGDPLPASVAKTGPSPDGEAPLPESPLHDSPVHDAAACDAASVACAIVLGLPLRAGQVRVEA